MKITKLGHCCLLIQVNEVTILTDPGTYSTGQNNIQGIDLVLITHEHADHLHLESLKAVLQNNSEAKIITNRSVGKILENENIKFEVVEDKQNSSFQGIQIEGIGTRHAVIYSDLPQVENTGYFINNKLFYPGDAFTNPNKPVDILALPVAGPWMKISEAIDYAKELKPKKVFPVHDGIYKQPGIVHFAPSKVLPENGIEFIVLETGKEYNLD